jgi:signal transduction histidine kinase
MTAPFGYLVKPFEASQLHATIKMALHQHKLERALHESEERLRHYAKRLMILHEIDQAILAAESPEAIARAALIHMHQLAPYRQASVILFDFAAGSATVLAVQANGEACLEEGMCFPLAMFRGIPMLEQGGHHLVEDILTLPDHLVPDDQLLAEGVRSYVSLPLIVQGKLFGSLNLEAMEPGVFGGEEIDIAHRVASSLAVAVCQARLYESVEHYCSELEVRNQDLAAFAHTVAHDLKDPLGIITGFSAALQEDYGTMPEAERLRCLAYITRSGFKMARIIHELLLLAEVREEEVEKVPLDMSDVVAEAQKHLHHIIDKQQAEIILPDSWPVALGYAPWVEEVWVNYISNAIKYGGKPPYMELGATAQSDGQIRCWVRDEGPGISPEDQKRLFTPFTRFTQQQVSGHGLGLSIVKRIVEKLGGQVGVESRMGQGCTFYFTLPAATDGESRQDLSMEWAQ